MKHCSLEAPPWVFRRLFGTHAFEAPLGRCAGWSSVGPHAPHENLAIRHLRGADETRLITLRLGGAAELDADAFGNACEWIYDRLKQEIQQLPSAERSWQVLRLWNFIPHILAPLGGLEHRYMVFNAGRYRAMERWLDEMENVATASGVGHFGDDFVVHCLIGHESGRAVENPRQIPAYRYSQRYGPLPPCFARATRIQCPEARSVAEARLLIGGTAAVRGEDSLFPEDLDAQLEETLVNLAAVTRAALRGKESLGESCPLCTFESVRVYYVRSQDREHIAQALQRRLPASTEIELRHAELCRPELLVEIEAVADFSRLQGAGAGSEPDHPRRSSEADADGEPSLDSRLAV